jgi:hypothetical protein
MVRDAIIEILVQIDRDALSDELGVPVGAINTGLSRFSHISARVEFDKGEVDFDIVLPKDTPDQAKEKFLAYVNTEHMGKVLEARDGLGRMDAPFYEAYAPDPPDDPN